MRRHVNKDFVFEYVKQPPLNMMLILLTKDNKPVFGPWKGEPLGQNKTYKAWTGLPDRDQDLERKMGYM
jgi:hypothetical protein